MSDEIKNEPIDDGSEKPLGYTTPDGELTVVITNGERHYQETDLGQTRRWMRQAPDLYEMYLKAVEGRAQLLAHMTRMSAEHLGREKAWSHDRQQMENDYAELCDKFEAVALLRAGTVQELSHHSATPSASAAPSTTIDLGQSHGKGK